MNIVVVRNLRLLSLVTATALLLGGRACGPAGPVWGDEVPRAAVPARLGNPPRDGFKTRESKAPQRPSAGTLAPVAWQPVVVDEAPKAAAVPPTAPPVAAEPPAASASAEPTPAAGAPETPAQTSAGERGSDRVERISLPMGDTYRLIIPESLGEYEGYILSRSGAVQVSPWPRKPNERELSKPSLQVLGVKFGDTELTLVGRSGKTAKYSVHVAPSLTHVEAMLLKQFPNCSVNVTQAATNILMVEGTVDSAEEVDPILLLLQNFVPQGRVINALRVGGVMQVQLDVTVASINRDKARELGFNFQNGQRPWYMGGQIGSIMAPPQVSTPTGAFLPGAGGSSTTPLTDRSTMFFGIAMPDDSFYGYLRALQENRCFKVLANPSLVTLSGRPARFQVGGEQPYPVPYGVGQTPQISFKPFGTTLVFTPLVLGQGKIRLDLQPTVSRLDPTNSVSLAGTTVPGIVTQEIKATVEMESGQTLVLGGLLESQITAQIEKVPVLGDVPFAGALFRRVQHVEQEKELMILATPHLVSPLEPQQFPERLPGDETRSPKDCELYLHGRPEVATGPCDVPTGLRSQLGAPPQGEPEPYPTWPPRNPGGPAPVGPRPEPDATPGPNLVPPPVDLSATSRLQRPTHATAGYSAPAESVGRGPQDSVAPLRRLPDAHLPPRLIGGPVRDGSPAQVVFPTYRQESP